MTDRELIRKVRKFVADDVLCMCRSRDGKLCKRCATLAMIDEGLAEIGKAVELKKKKAWDMHDAEAFKREADEALRFGDSQKAIKLYDRAFKLERR